MNGRFIVVAVELMGRIHIIDLVEKELILRDCQGGTHWISGRIGLDGAAIVSETAVK